MKGQRSVAKKHSLNTDFANPKRYPVRRGVALVELSRVLHDDRVLSVAKADIPLVRDRQTQQIVRDRHVNEAQLRWAYEDPVGRWIFDRFLNGWLYSAYKGLTCDWPASRRRIPAFVARTGIDVAEAELPIGEYPSFNEFFARRLKPACRPIDPDPDSLIAPADGKVLAYPELSGGTRLPIKGARLTLATLLGSECEAARFAGGSAVVVRLAPHDYHRFHFAADGIAGVPRGLAGRYHSVHPLALAHEPDVFCLNKRTVTRLETGRFGTIACVEVGAVTVGTIRQTFEPGPVLKGSEKGHFRYGGSTVVLVLEPGAVIFDADLVRDTLAGIEVQVRYGTRIGLAAR